MEKMHSNRSAWRLAAAVLIATAILTSCADCGFEPEPEPPTMDGTWAGVVSDTYACEGGSYTLEIVISGSDITVTGGTVLLAGTTGTLTHQEGNAYTVMMDITEPAEGQLFVDAERNYGVFFLHLVPTAGYMYVVGVLQKGSLADVTYTEDDLVGEWAGAAAHVNADLEVTWTSTSSATMYESAGIILDGTDGDGDFAGLLYLDDPLLGTYASGPVDWPAFSREALCALSLDKKALAVAFLTDACEYELDLVLPDQKFTLWLKQ